MNLIFLEEIQEPYVPFEPVWIAFIVLAMAPWIFVIFRYVIFRRLRVSFMLPDGTILSHVMLKKNSHIDLPEVPTKKGEEFKGWYIDKELTTEYIDMPMPNKNIKLYAKIEKTGLELGEIKIDEKN